MRNEWENPEMSHKKNGGHTGSSPFFLFSASANGLGPKF